MTLFCIYFLVFDANVFLAFYLLYTFRNECVFSSLSKRRYVYIIKVICLGSQFPLAQSYMYACFYAMYAFL